MALQRPLGDPLVDLVARPLRVLGQPVRVRLIDRLDRLGEAHVQALADELEASQQNASKHLGALWRAGTIRRRGLAQRRRRTVSQAKITEPLVRFTHFDAVAREIPHFRGDLRDWASAAPFDQTSTAFDRRRRIGVTHAPTE